MIFNVFFCAYAFLDVKMRGAAPAATTPAPTVFTNSLRSRPRSLFLDIRALLACGMASHPSRRLVAYLIPHVQRAKWSTKQFDGQHLLIRRPIRMDVGADGRGWS